MSEDEPVGREVPSKGTDPSSGAPLCNKSGRHEERYPITGEAEVVFKSDGSMFRGRILNISPSGCYVQTLSPITLPPGAIVKLMINARGGSLQIVAETRFSTPKTGMGFRFLEMTKEICRKLSHLIDIATQPKVPVKVPRRVWHDTPKR